MRSNRGAIAQLDRAFGMGLLLQLRLGAFGAQHQSGLGAPGARLAGLMGAAITREPPELERGRWGRSGRRQGRHRRTRPPQDPGRWPTGRGTARDARATPEWGQWGLQETKTRARHEKIIIHEPPDAPSAEPANTVREASQALLDWQRAALSQPLPPAADPLAQAAALQACFDRWGGEATERERAGWSAIRPAGQRGPASAAALEVRCRRFVRRGPGRAAAPSTQALDETDELDIAVRYWEQARKAVGWTRTSTPTSASSGAASSGARWRNIWRCWARAAPDEARLAAFAAKTASRYVQLSPLKRLAEKAWPPLLRPWRHPEMKAWLCDRLRPTARHAQGKPLVYCADASPEGFDPGLWGQQQHEQCHAANL